MATPRKKNQKSSIEPPNAGKEGKINLFWG
jgi:hypothetical protein